MPSSSPSNFISTPCGVPGLASLESGWWIPLLWRHLNGCTARPVRCVEILQCHQQSIEAQFFLNKIIEISWNFFVLTYRHSALHSNTYQTLMSSEISKMPRSPCWSPAGRSGRKGTMHASHASHCYVDHIHHISPLILLCQCHELSVHNLHQNIQEKFMGRMQEKSNLPCPALGILCFFFSRTKCNHSITHPFFHPFSSFRSWLGL